MKYYLVGTAEPIFQTSFLGGFKEREFSEDDLLINISQMDTIPLFESLVDAMDYARSLRIQRSSKILNPQKIQFAPVIEIDCEDDTTLEIIKRHDPQNLTVECTEYIDTRSNFGDLPTREAVISCRMVPKSSINLATIHINSLLLPDSGRCQQHFMPNASCTLM